MLDAQEHLPDVGPADRFVYTILYYHDEPATYEQLERATGLSRRRLRMAMNKLCELDRVERLDHRHDERYVLFSVEEDNVPAVEA